MKKFLAIGLLSAVVFACGARAESLSSVETRPTIDTSVAASAVDLESMMQTQELNTSDFSPNNHMNRIRVKNQSNRFVCVTLTMENPLRSIGWFVLANGQEADFVASYIHAEECGNTGVSWNPGWDMNFFCQHPTQKFDYFTPQDGFMCNQLGAQMTKFFRVPSANPFFTWTLNY